MRHDLVIRGASVYDGTGAKPFLADVAVNDDRIAAVTPLDSGGIVERGGVEEEARGLALSPGFIDVHSHDDFAALLTPELPFKLLQGVTTEIVGNCGMGVAPFGAAQELLRAFHPGKELSAWDGYHGFFARLDAEPPSANLAVLCGHGTLRGEVMPNGARVADAGERLELRRLLSEALDAGSIGLSTGLIYEPGKHADRLELVELARELGPLGALYTTHLRNEADELLDAVQEAIDVCQAAGASLQLSHHKAHGRNNWGRVNESLALVDEARGRGLDVWLDQYPYTAGSTLLRAVLASGSIGAPGKLGRLKPEDVVIASVSGSPELDGKNLGELAIRWGLDVHATAERVLGIDADCWVVVHAMSEDDVQRVMRHPATLIGSDGIPTESGRPHPRLHGTFPRVLGHYGRDLGLFSLEEAIHKMTGLSARRFGLENRGVIAPSAFADFVLFDAASVVDVATFEDPRRDPRGIAAVYVNGRRVVHQGHHTGARPGRALRRAGRERSG